MLARDPAAVPRRPGVTVTQGDATAPDAVYEAVASADVAKFVIGALTGSSYHHQTPAICW